MIVHEMCLICFRICFCLFWCIDTCIDFGVITLVARGVLLLLLMLFIVVCMFSFHIAALYLHFHTFSCLWLLLFGSFCFRFAIVNCSHYLVPFFVVLNCSFIYYFLCECPFLVLCSLLFLLHIFFCRILLDFFFIYKNEWNTQTHNLFNYYFFFITQNHFVVSVIFKCIILNISQW